MAEPTTQPLPDTAGQDFVYRPLSGVAVAGVAVASCYALLLLVYGAAALWRGDPFLLPLWLLLLPLAGVILSLLGRWHILRSEDTRAGMALTRYGLWIALITGLGYATFYFVTYLAITTQADHFLMVVKKDPKSDIPYSGFLTLLQDGEVNVKDGEVNVKVNAAFLLTRTLSDRTGMNPSINVGGADRVGMEDRFDQPISERMPLGLLSVFARDALVRRLGSAGNKAKIEPLGVKSWTYENGGYKVERFYRIETPEGTFEVLIALQSVSVPGEERKWFVLWQPKQWLTPLKLTTLGQTRKTLREKSATIANEWFAKIFTRNSLSAYLDTQPVSQRPQLDKNAKLLVRLLWSEGVPGGPAFGPLMWNLATAMHPQALPEQLKTPLLPSFDEFLRGTDDSKERCLHLENLRCPNPAVQNLVHHRLVGFVKEPVLGQFPISIRPEDVLLSKVEETPAGVVTVTHPFEFPLTVAQTRPGQAPLIAGKIVLETNAAHQGWRVVRVDFLRALAPAPAGGPGGAGGGGG